MGGKKGQRVFQLLLVKAVDNDSEELYFFAVKGEQMLGIFANNTLQLGILFILISQSAEMRFFLIPPLLINAVFNESGECE